MARWRFVAVCALLAIAACGEADAHEFWLSPSTYHPLSGDLVTVSMYVGTGFRGEVKPYAKPRTVRFVVRDQIDRDLMPLATNGDPIAARFHTGDHSGSLIAYESNFATIELPAVEFDTYLKLEGLSGPLAKRTRRGALEGSGRERYARCAKTWIGNNWGSRVTKPVGLTLEIVPLADPTGASLLAVRVLLRGRPLSGALVRAWNRPLAGAQPVDPASRDSVGAVIDVRTNTHGEARLDIRRAGEWLLSTVHMEPSTDTAQADWQSWWASLSFGRARREGTAR